MISPIKEPHGSNYLPPNKLRLERRNIEPSSFSSKHFDKSADFFLNERNEQFFQYKRYFKKGEGANQRTTRACRPTLWCLVTAILKHVSSQLFYQNHGNSAMLYYLLMVEIDHWLPCSILNVSLPHRHEPEHFFQKLKLLDCQSSKALASPLHGLNRPFPSTLFSLYSRWVYLQSRVLRKRRDLENEDLTPKTPSYENEEDPLKQKTVEIVVTS